MLSQSARLYLERAGITPTRRSAHRPTIDVSGNAALRSAAVITPPVQLVLDDNGNPDRAGTASEWPNDEVQRVPGH